MNWNRRLHTAALCVCAYALFGARPAAAQGERAVDVGLQLQLLRLSAFDATDAGIGVEGAWRVAPRLTLEGALAAYPGSDEARPRVAGQSRVLGLIGIRSGIRNGPVELFGRVRPGFLRFVNNGPAACILIFPAPLECQLLGGRTTLATELGGGARLALGTDGRTYLSFDLGDLLVRYTRQAIKPDGEITDGFVSHNLLASVGVGWRF